MESSFHAVCFALDWVKRNNLHIDVMIRLSPRKETTERESGRNLREDLSVGSDLLSLRTARPTSDASLSIQ